MSQQKPAYRGLVRVEQIRPIGRLKFAAKVVGMKRVGKNGQLEHVAEWSSHEYFGETEHEADAAARAEATRWIEERGGVAELT